MIFTALIYTQFELKERIQLDESVSLIPLGWGSLRDCGHGAQVTSGFKFAYVETGIKPPSRPFDNLGFSDTRVKQFLEFLSLVTHDGHPIREFEERAEGARYFKSEEEVSKFLTDEQVNEKRSGMPILENEFSIKYDFQQTVGGIKLTEAWGKFLEKDEMYRDMVSLYCIKMSGMFNKVYEVFNKETVQLFFSIVLIEGLLDARSKCSGSLTCSSCGPIPLKHYAHTTENYWRDELNKKLKFVERSEYINLILLIHAQVRNGFAHAGSLLPDAGRVTNDEVHGPHTRLLQLPKIITDFNKDTLARSNVLMMMHDIVWFMLMDAFFPGHIKEPWPQLGILKEYRSH